MMTSTDEEDDLESEAFASKPNLQFNMEQAGANETLLAKFENMWREMLSKETKSKGGIS